MKVSGSFEHLIRIYDTGFKDPFHQDFFNHSGFSNFGYWGKLSFSPEQACDLLVKLASPKSVIGNTPVLDVACGEGGTTRTLSQIYPSSEIYGINISKKQITSARQACPRATLEVMDACELKFKDDFFGHILCLEAAFHFKTRQTFISEAYRVLKSGGTLSMTDIIFRINPPSNIIPRENMLKNIETFKLQLKAAGFVDIEVENIIQKSWQPFSRKLIRFAFLRLLNKRNLTSLTDFLKTIDRVLKYNIAFKSYLLIKAKKP